MTNLERPPLYIKTQFHTGFGHVSIRAHIGLCLIPQNQQNKYYGKRAKKEANAKDTKMRYWERYLHLIYH